MLWPIWFVADIVVSRRKHPIVSIGIVLIPSYKIFGLLNNKLTKTANFQDPWYLNVKLL